MGRVDQQLWRDIMDYLRRKHPAICRQWFDELRPLELQGGLLRVHSPNPVQQHSLQKKCLEPFTEAAQAVTGALIAVRFVGDVNEPALDEDDSDNSAPDATPPAPAAAVPSATPAGAEAPAAPTPAPVAPPRRPNNITRSEPVDESQWDQDQIVLSPDYRFDAFVTGPGNQLAYAASVAVANQPGKAYNPLFIHGGVGLGKTHLLQAICQTILERPPNAKKIR